MYYYGYGGYGYNNPCCTSYPVYPSYGYQNGSSSSAIILVLFILLVIVIGSRFLNN